jgi:hypothetical protein
MLFCNSETEVIMLFKIQAIGLITVQVYLHNHEGNVPEMNLNM